MANQTGKRYICAKCGTEMLVTKAGEGSLKCCGEEMQIRGTTAPASSQQSSS